MSTATETHLIHVDVIDTDLTCKVLVTGPWYVEAHIGQQLIPVIDPSDLDYEFNGYRVTIEVVGDQCDYDGSLIPGVAEATVVEID